MFNNINDNNGFFYDNSQLDRQNIINLAKIRDKLSAFSKTDSTNPYVDRTEISSNAIELFKKDCDIKKFTKIAMSDLNDLSHLDAMKELFASGVTDPFDENIISKLVTNSKLWDDLGL